MAVHLLEGPGYVGLARRDGPCNWVIQTDSTFAIHSDKEIVVRFEFRVGDLYFSGPALLELSGTGDMTVLFKDEPVTLRMDRVTLDSQLTYPTFTTTVTGQGVLQWIIQR